MRPLALAVALVLAGNGVARADDEFWLEVATPHHKQVTELVQKATTAISNADTALANGDVKWSRAELDEAFGAMTFARTLAPNDPEMLVAYASVAERIGRIDEAVAALQAAIPLAVTDDTTRAANGQLGLIYLRRGQLDDAIHYLEATRGGVENVDAEAPQYVIALANALALRGRSREATDTLVDAVPHDFAGSPSVGGALIMVALAVRLDQLEQRSAAFETIDRVQVALQGQELVQYLDTELATMRFTPAVERHYYLGMIYEVTGFNSEARAELALYAATAGAPFRKRALEHVAAIDQTSRAAAIAPPVDPNGIGSLSLPPPPPPPPPPGGWGP